MEGADENGDWNGDRVSQPHDMETGPGSSPEPGEYNGSTTGILPGARAATQRHLRYQQQQQQPQPLVPGATAAVSINIPWTQQAQQQAHGQPHAKGTPTASHSSGGAPAVTRLFEGVSRAWLRLWRRQQYRLSDSLHRQAVGHHHRRPHTHGSSRLPPSLLLFGLALLVLLPTLVLLRVSAPHYPGSSDSSSTTATSGSSRRGDKLARHSIAGPADAAAGDGGNGVDGVNFPTLAYEAMEPVTGTQDSAAAAAAAAATAAAAAGVADPSLPCISPSRATPWEVALAAAAAAAQPGAGATQEQQQQQQQVLGVEPLAAMFGSHEAQQQAEQHQELQEKAQEQQQQLVGVGEQQQMQQQADAVGIEDPHADAAAAADTDAGKLKGRHLQQQQQQQDEGSRRLTELQPQQQAVASHVMAAALVVSGGNKTLAAAVLEDKALVNQLVAGVAQAAATEKQQQKLLAAAAATPVPPVLAASAAESGSGVGAFYDKEAADAAAEAWPAAAAALAAAASSGTADSTAAGAGAGDHSDYFDAEAAAGDAGTAEFFDHEAAADPEVDLPALPEPTIGSGIPTATSISSTTSSGVQPTTPAGTGSDATTAAAAAAAATTATAAAVAAESVAESASSGLSLALVNDVEFHHEVTLGLMAALQQHNANLKVYLHGSLFRAKQPGDTSFDFVTYANSVMPGTKLVNAHNKEAIPETDVAIFVSPEFSINYYRTFLNRARPRLVVVFIHEPNMALSRLQYIINMHPLVGVVALAPHVADIIRSRMRMDFVHWMMPSLPGHCSNDCWEGFAVQGKFEASRRSYGVLWDAMQQHLQAAAGLQRHLLHQTPAQAQHQQLSLPPAAPQHDTGVAAASSATWLAWLRQALHRLSSGGAGSGRGSSSSSSSGSGSSSSGRSAHGTAAGLSLPSRLPQWSDDSSSSTSSRALQSSTPMLPRINLMGSGDVRGLGVTPQLQPFVKLYLGLSYGDYYDTACRSLALLPLFNATSGYLRDKISSTVLTSVAVGVPMVVPPAFLDVYTEFKREHVIVLDLPSPTDEGVDSAAGAVLMQQLERLSGPGAGELLRSKRKALERLRYVLNHQAAAKLDGLIAAAKGKPHAGAKQD